MLTISYIPYVFIRQYLKKHKMKLTRKNQSRETKVKIKYDQNQPEHYN